MTLIEDIIKLSRLDEDELRAEFAPVELHGLCEAVLGELAAKAEKIAGDAFAYGRGNGRKRLRTRAL